MIGQIQLIISCGEELQILMKLEDDLVLNDFTYLVGMKIIQLLVLCLIYEFEILEFH